MSDEGFHEQSEPAKENAPNWGELHLLFEDHSTNGCQYFAQLNGSSDGRVVPIAEKEIIHMTQCQQWYLRHYKFVPPNMTKEAWVEFRDRALAGAERRETAVGLKPEDQAIAVIMKVLKTHLPNLQRIRDGGHPRGDELGELLEVEGAEYMVVGEQTLYLRIKRWRMDEIMGVKMDQRQVGAGLRAIPGSVQFDRETGRCERWEHLRTNLNRRSKYAVPVVDIEAYETI